MFSNYPIPNGLPVTPVHWHRFLSHALRWLYVTSQWRAATCAAGKTKSAMTANWWYSKQLPSESYKTPPSDCWPAWPSRLTIYRSLLKWWPLCRHASYQPPAPMFSAASWPFDKAQHDTHYLLLTPSLLHPDFISAMIDHTRKLLINFLPKTTETLIWMSWE